MGDDQFKQLHQLLSTIESRLSALEKGQDEIGANVDTVKTSLKDHREESRKEHEEMGLLVGGLAEHTDRSIVSAQEKTVQMLSDRVSTVLQHQDKRITRLERNAGLAPLE